MHVRDGESDTRLSARVQRVVETEQERTCSHARDDTQAARVENVAH